MKRIITNGITNLEPLPGSSKWYWGSDYASNDLYEAEELFRSGHPIDKNRLVLVHCPEGTVYEPVCTKPGQYLGRPVYYDGRVVLLMVDFPKEEIRILTFHEAVETTKPLAVLPLSKAMALSYDEMQQLFEQKGFKGFSMRAYDAEIENLISEAAEDNAKAYLIDIVPGDLEYGQNDGIALLEKHYYKEANMARLLRKWLDIVLHFSCYYPLETVLVTGVGLPDIEDFKEQTPNEEGYFLEIPMESIDDMDELSDLVFQKTFGTMRFLFPTLDMVIHIETGEVYNIVLSR